MGNIKDKNCFYCTGHNYDCDTYVKLNEDTDMCVYRRVAIRDLTRFVTGGVTTLTDMLNIYLKENPDVADKLKLAKDKCRN